VEPNHLRLDLSIVGSRAVAVHDAECPEIGPICAVRPEPPQRHRTTLLATDIRLFAEYGLLPGLAVQGMLPVRVVGTRTAFSDLSGRPISLDYPSIHHRNETLLGLGDAQLLLHRGFKLWGVALGARAGVSIPLGTVREDPYRLGQEGLPHQHIQMGTGTWDPVVSLDASANIAAFSLGAFAGLQAPLYEGSRGYRAGARTAAGVVLSRSFDPVTPRLSGLVLHERPERWHGRVPAEDGNQGRTDVYVGPGATWNFAGEWMVSADVRVRAFSHVVNAQLDMPVVLEFGIGRLFHLEPGFNEPEQAAPPGADVIDVVQAGELSDLRPPPGKWTVFDFWASWCEPCKVLYGQLRELAARQPGIAIRRINVVDFDSPIARRELPGVSQLPHVRLVGPDGAVVYEASGPPEQLMTAIQARTKAQ
jgi:thiol-disulfide isomerase/thioredoxin